VTDRFDATLSAFPTFDEDRDVVRLLGSRCRDCDAAAFPRRHVCLECAGPHDPARLAGAGVVHARTHLGTPPRGFAAAFTYLCVDLDEGPRVLAPAVCADAQPPIGARVQAVPAAVRDGRRGFRFAVIDDA
jgi:uncharacterized OB-fold protein